MTKLQRKCSEHLKQCFLQKHCAKSVQIRSYFWSIFSRSRTEYGEIGRFSGPYSVRMWENTDQKQLRIWTLFTQQNSQRRLLPNWPLQTAKNSSEYKNILWMVKQLFVRVLVRYFLGYFWKTFLLPQFNTGRYE